MPEVIARYKIIIVVISCIIDKFKTIGIGIFKKYGIALIKGILYKITYTNSPNTESKKNNIEINID